MFASRVLSYKPFIITRYKKLKWRQSRNEPDLKNILVYFSENIYIRLIYWLNNNLEKHMLLKKSSGMKTAWHRLI